jgi:hypothetical protein
VSRVRLLTAGVAFAIIASIALAPAPVPAVVSLVVLSAAVLVSALWFGVVQTGFVLLAIGVAGIVADRLSDADGALATVAFAAVCVAVIVTVSRAFGNHVHH